MKSWIFRLLICSGSLSSSALFCDQAKNDQEYLHTSYWSLYGGHGSPDAPKKGPGTTTEFLKDLVDDVNFRAARSVCADPNKFPPGLSPLTSYQADIYSIHFYGSVCIIKKK